MRRHGAAIGYVGVSVDISSRHHVEVSLRQTAEFLNVLTTGMAEGLVALDQDGLVTFVNPAAESLLGWDREALLGRELHPIAHHKHSDDSPYPAEECPIATAARRGIPARVERDSFFRADGSRVPVAYTASPLGSESDRGPRGCVVVFRDVSSAVFEESEAEKALEKLSWVGRIQDALDDERFVLYAQPIVEPRTRAVVHHELLLRMNSPWGELIAPDRFIPVAEEFGLIGKIDRWVIDQAIELAGRGHSVAFNLSARSVCDPRMLDFMRDRLTRRPAGGAALICEVTETALMEDAEAAERFVTTLADMGCAVALDDFGAGFAGFGYLKTLPVSTLKIDRKFIGDAVTDEASRHVITAVVALARAFRLETIAEGAEDEATVAILDQLGVDFVQGYVFSRPQPVDEVFRKGTDGGRT